MGSTVIAQLLGGQVSVRFPAPRSIISTAYGERRRGELDGRIALPSRPGDTQRMGEREELMTPRMMGKLVSRRS